MEEQFQGLEVEYPYDNNNNNTNNNGLLQPVIPGTNLPIQTEDVVMAREPENLPCSGPDISFIEETKVVESTVLIGPFTNGLEEDPHSPKTHIPAPPSNYQTKVTDPTGEGGKEVEVDPLLFHVHDQSTPTVDEAIKSEPTVLIGPSKTTDPTVEGGKEVEVDPLLQRLDNFHVDHDQLTPTIDEVSSNKKPVTEMATEYGHKAAEMLAPVYEKVADVGNAVFSKFGSDKGLSVREYLGEKLRPGEDDKALSEAIFGKKEEEVVVVQNVDEVAGKKSLQKGVMDRLKSAVGSSSSWLGKSRSDIGTNPSPDVVEEEATTMGQTTSE